MDQVAAAGREPDFAELLKAAIETGSLAKGGPSETTFYNYQYTQDTDVDLQVIQIMANLIDQQDTDSYPTIIALGDNVNVGGGNFYAYGVEDLPYFYRAHPFTVVDSLPGPNTPQSSVATITPLKTTATVYNTTALVSGAQSTGSGFSLSTPINAIPGMVKLGTAAPTGFLPGEVTYFYVPCIWNPHDNLNGNSNLVTGNPALRPTTFRTVMIAGDVEGLTTLDPSVAIGAEAEYPAINSTTKNGLGQTVPTAANTQLHALFPEIASGTQYNWPISNVNATPLATYGISSLTAASGNNIIQFSDNGGQFFREPTLLWSNKIPNMNLVGPSALEVNTGKTYYGFLIGKTPINTYIQAQSNPARPTDGYYALQAPNVAAIIMNSSGTTNAGTSGGAQFSYVMQYQDSSGNWVTYDVKFGDNHQNEQVLPSVVAAEPDFSGNTGWENPFNNQNSDNQFLIGCSIDGMDPRTDRWGMGDVGALGDTGQNGTHLPYLLEPTANANAAPNGTNGNPTSTNSQAMLADYPSVVETNRSAS